MSRRRAKRKHTKNGVRLVPITISKAKQFISRHHRTHPPPLSALFAVAAAKDDAIIGVATVGRPIARDKDRGYTAEVTRLCVLENNPNACSMLYAACWRAAQALGYTSIITYTAEDQHGISLKASGWTPAGTTKRQSWNTPSRPRDSSITGPKQRWTKGNEEPGPRPTFDATPLDQGQLPLQRIE